MKVSHLNCGSFRPLSPRLVRGDGGWRGGARAVAHCLLLETERDGLVLVDTGFGAREVDAPSRVHWSIRAELRPALDGVETAIARVRALGHDPHDVRHVVFTHLDLDHACGLADFPWATAHVAAGELEAASHVPALPTQRLRYKRDVLAAHRRWATHGPGGDGFLGFPGARAIEPLGGDVVLVPLPGHTRGHHGVAVRSGDGWLLHAGDAYMDRAELDQRAGAGLHQRLIEADPPARRETVERLRDLAAAGTADVFCSHDAAELGRREQAV